MMLRIGNNKIIVEKIWTKEAKKIIEREQRGQREREINRSQNWRVTQKSNDRKNNNVHTTVHLL